MDFCFLHLKPVAWSQGLRRYPKNIEGPVLRATCTAVSKFLLSDPYKLQDVQIELSIFRGEVDALKERKELSEAAIGGIWWARDALVHGFFFLKADDYAALWDGVRDGGDVAWEITLGVRPVRADKEEIAWSGNPLSIETAEVNFPPQRKKPTNHEKFLFLEQRLGRNSFCLGRDSVVLSTVEWAVL
jgi:hypothetical protein